jgi:hypothetical protein
MEANRGGSKAAERIIEGYKAREMALRERGAGSPHGGGKEVGDSDTSDTRSPERVSGEHVSEASEAWAEALKAFAARDRLALQLQSGAQVLQDMREDLAFAAAEAAAIMVTVRDTAESDDVVTTLQAHLQQQKQTAETLQAELKAERGAGAALRKRFEREEKLAAERGADIEDLTERLKALQSASR